MYVVHPCSSVVLRKSLAACVALLAGTATTHASQIEVVGGHFTAAWPGMGTMLILYGQEYIECSATLIAPNWALTAAHCLDLGGTPMFTMAFDYLSQGATYYTADSTFVHPSHVPGSHASSPYDVALLHFPTAIPAMPYRLNDSSGLVQVGDHVQFIGYGQDVVGPEGSDNNTTRNIGLTSVSFVDAHGMGSQSGSYPCFGDSGSAWFKRGSDGFPLILGVQSYLVDECNNISYANAIPDVLDFISAHVTDLCLRSNVGAPCDGVFRDDLESAP